DEAARGVLIVDDEDRRLARGRGTRSRRGRDSRRRGCVSLGPLLAVGHRGTSYADSYTLSRRGEWEILRVQHEPYGGGRPAMSGMAWRSSQDLATWRGAVQSWTTSVVPRGMIRLVPADWKRMVSLRPSPAPSFWMIVPLPNMGCVTIRPTPKSSFPRSGA